MFAFLVCGCYFGWTISSISSLMENVNKSEARIDDMRTSLQEYLMYRKYPKHLAHAIRHYYEFYWQRVTGLDEHGILSGLTPTLQCQAVQFLVQDMSEKLPLLAHLGLDFQIQVLPRLKPFCAGKGEVIMKKGDMAKDIIFLCEGQVSINGRIETTKPTVIMGKGSCFGESALIGGHRDFTATACSWCELYSLTVDDLDELCQAMPRQCRLLIQIIMHRAPSSGHR